MITPTPHRSPPRIAGAASDEVLRRLHLDVSRRLDGLLQGDHRGLVPGHGSEPGESRRYLPGDDVRRIDWAVTARSAEPHVRESIADRELETWLVVDASPSMAFGTAQCEKRDLALAATAAVAHLTSGGGNRVGAVVADPDGSRPTTLPARGGRAHVGALLARCLDTLAPPHQSFGLAPALERTSRTARRRGLVVVVSDFLDGTNWDRPLTALGLRHDVLAVEVLDPREVALPDVGLVRLTDPESGRELVVDVGDPRLRERFAAAAAAQRSDIARRLRSAGADHLVLRTDEDWLLALARFVGRRPDRLAARARASTARVVA